MATHPDQRRPVSAQGVVAHKNRLAVRGVDGVFNSAAVLAPGARQRQPGRGIDYTGHAVVEQQEAILRPATEKGGGVLAAEGAQRVADQSQRRRSQAALLPVVGRQVGLADAPHDLSAVRGIGIDQHDCGTAPERGQHAAWGHLQGIDVRVVDGKAVCGAVL